MRIRMRPDRTVCAPVGPYSVEVGVEVGVEAGVDTGMVTAEFAVVLPAIVVALVFGLVAVATFAMHVRCADAAQVAARLAARGEPESAVVAAAARIAPSGAHVHVDVRDGEVDVSVDAVAHPPVLGGLLPGVAVSGMFSEPVEPGPPP